MLLGPRDQCGEAVANGKPSNLESELRIAPDLICQANASNAKPMAPTCAESQ